MTELEKYNVLKNFLKQDPVDYAIKNTFSNDCIKLLKGHDILSREIESCKYGADRRDVNKFALEVVRIWEQENFIRDKLNTIPNVFAYLEGVDYQREFLFQKDVKTTPDFRIRVYYDEFNHEDFLNDLVSDYGRFWQSKHHGHLRDNKLPKLVELSKSENVFVMACDADERAIGFVEINPGMEAELDDRYVKSHPPFGGKPAYIIDIDTTKFFSVEDIGLCTQYLKKKAS